MVRPRYPRVQFENIKVNAIESNSGIFVGTNSQFYWKTISQTKSGFGSVKGHQNEVSKNINIFHDDDIIDTPIHGETILPSSNIVT